jgi:ABC-type branched-subunit amino acid transport system permease subunit
MHYRLLFLLLIFILFGGSKEITGAVVGTEMTVLVDAPGEG